MSVDELTRLAFIYAEQDRYAMAGAWPPGSRERTRAKKLADRMKAYRLKRWGRTTLEDVLEGATSKDVLDLK